MSLNTGRLKSVYCCESTAIAIETATTAAALTTTTVETTASTATAGTAITVEAASATTATAALAGRTVFSGVHTKGAPLEFRTIQSLDGSFGLFSLIHRYKSKTFGSPSGEIRNNFNPGNCSVRTEHFTECIFTCRIGQIAHVDIHCYNL